MLFLLPWARLVVQDAFEQKICHDRSIFGHSNPDYMVELAFCKSGRLAGLALASPTRCS